VTEFDVGSALGCGLRLDATPACWGSSLNSFHPPQVPMHGISVGESVACALRPGTNEAICFGNDDEFGQLDPPAGPFTQVSAGGWHACGIRPDGTVECWGFGEQGETAAPAGQFQQLSAGRHHTCGVHTDGTIACWGSSVLHRLDAPAGQFERVDVTQVVGCGIRVNGSVACWGDNSSWLNNQTSELELDKVSLKFQDICGLR